MERIEKQGGHLTRPQSHPSIDQAIPPPEDEGGELAPIVKAKTGNGRKRAIAAIVVAAILISASIMTYLFISNMDAPSDQDEATLGENVKFPEENESLQSIIVGNESVTFTYNSTPSGDGFSVGDIIVGEEGYGYLRNVTSVEVSGNSVTLTTKNASLAEAIESGTIKCNQTVDLSTGVNVTSIAQWNPASAFQAGDEYAIPYDDVLSDSPEVRISGEIRMIFKINLKLKFENHRLSESVVGVQFNTFLSYELKTFGPATLHELVHVWDKELKVISIPVLSKIPIVGNILSKLFPLRITPILGFDVDAQVDVQSSATARGELYGNYSIGIEYDNVTRGWGSYKVLQEGYHVEKPDSAAPGEISCSGIFPTLKLMIFDMIGPSVGIQQVQKVTWSLPDGENVTHAVSIGLYANVGVHVKVLWIELLDKYIHICGEMRAMTNPEHGVENW